MAHCKFFTLSQYVILWILVERKSKHNYLVVITLSQASAITLAKNPPNSIYYLQNRTSTKELTDG